MTYLISSESYQLIPILRFFINWSKSTDSYQLVHMNWLIRTDSDQTAYIICFLRTDWCRLNQLNWFISTGSHESFSKESYHLVSHQLESYRVRVCVCDGELSVAGGSLRRGVEVQVVSSLSVPHGVSLNEEDGVWSGRAGNRCCSAQAALAVWYPL